MVEELNSRLPSYMLEERAQGREAERQQYIDKYGSAIGSAYDGVIHQEFGTEGYAQARAKLVDAITDAHNSPSREETRGAVLATLDISQFEARLAVRRHSATHLPSKRF